MSCQYHTALNYTETLKQNDFFLPNDVAIQFSMENLLKEIQKLVSFSRQKLVIST